MRRVSLLPEKYKLRKSEAKKINRVLTISVVIASFFLVLFILTLILLSSYSSRLKDVLEGEARLSRDIISLSGYSDIERLLEDISAAERESGAGSPDLYRIVCDVSDSLPAGITLSSLSVRYLGGKGSLEAEGVSGSYDAVSAWIEALSDVDGLSEIKLVRSASDGEGSMKFKIEAALGEN